MAEKQNNGQNPPKLDRVQRGQAITADAWNQIVDRLNQPLDVSIRRTKRPKGKGGGNTETLTVLTSISVVNGALVWTTETRDFVIG